MAKKKEEQKEKETVLVEFLKGSAHAGEVREINKILAQKLFKNKKIKFL